MYYVLGTRDDGRRRRQTGYRTKNKNPTQRCGEKNGFSINTATLKKTRESRRDMLQPQNERFVRDFLLCSCFVAPCRRFPNFLLEFSTSKSMFCARRPSSSAHLTKCRACHGICTLSPLDADLTIRFAKTRHTARLKCCVYATQNGDGGLQSAAPATKNAAHLLETMQRYSRLPRETKLRDVWNLQK